MPTDLLLPAFFLTLVVNALFVAVAIRALRDGRDGRERRDGATASRAPVEPTAQPRVADGTPVAAPGSVASPAPVVAPAAPTPAVAHDPTPEPVDLPEPAVPPAQPAVATPTRPAPDAGAPAPAAVVVPAAAADPGTGKGRPARRRKFSLPPAEDPEKVSRSIETFLAGGEAAGAASSGTDVPSSASPASAGVPLAVVTVAAIQVDGGRRHEVLERTVRSTARATDQVTVDRRGRVRVVLRGTGEVAAHAYLRRIRAIVEPVVEAEDPAARIMIATATELDGEIVTARRRADRRLALALGAARLAPDADPAGSAELEDDIDEPGFEPRAAGD